LEVSDKIIHNPKICVELRGHSATLIQPSDYLSTPWMIQLTSGPISTTLRTTGVKFHVFIGQLWCKIHWILQARATNTILYDCIPVILYFYSEGIQHKSTTVV